MASAIEPTTKIGRPRIAGSPACATAAGAAGSATAGVGVDGDCWATADMATRLLTHEEGNEVDTRDHAVGQGPADQGGWPSTSVGTDASVV